MAFVGLIAVWLSAAVLAPMRGVCALFVRIGLTVSFLPVGFLFAFGGLALIIGEGGELRNVYLYYLWISLAAVTVGARVVLNRLDDVAEQVDEPSAD